MADQLDTLSHLAAPYRARLVALHEARVRRQREARAAVAVAVVAAFLAGGIGGAWVASRALPECLPEVSDGR